jgi:hypothetical protein
MRAGSEGVLMVNRFDNVVMCARAESRLFNLALAKELVSRGDCKMHLYCSSREQVADYQSLPEASLFDSIQDGYFLLETSLELVSDPDEVMRASMAWEDLLGYPIATISVASRHLGRGFSLGGFYHARSRYSEESSHIQVLNAYSKVLDFWDREFTEKQITLVINGYKEAACVARLHKIPFRSMAGSRYQNYHYWGWNEHYDNPNFDARYHELGIEDIDDGEGMIDAPYYTHQVNRKRFLSDIGHISFLRRFSTAILRFVYWKLRGYQKARGYAFADRLRAEIRRWREYRKLQRCAVETVAELKKRPYVYYPLHVEPEAALQVVSPEFIYQLSLITAVARDLPAQAVLGVKEAYGAVGRRPDNFYDQILEFKNVILFETMERGIECAQNAAAVVTISGTAGLEAAVAGVPVVSFGHHNIYNVLPHVRIVEDERDLAGYLKDAIDNKFSRAQMLCDGRRLCRAIVKESFDMREYNYIDLEDFDPQSVLDACASLRQSVNGVDDPVWQPERRTRSKIPEDIGSDTLHSEQAPTSL